MNTVTTVDRYVTELGAALHVRGAARRRLLRECRDHLADAAAERGEQEAVRAFGPPAEIAAAFDAEIAARRGVRSTFATAAGVLATGGSTLALIHAASANATAPVWWAIAFFVGAQVAGVGSDWRWCRRSCCDVPRWPPPTWRCSPAATAARSWRPG